MTNERTMRANTFSLVYVIVDYCASFQRSRGSQRSSRLSQSPTSTSSFAAVAFRAPPHSPPRRPH
eukprot:30497-Pelagococcus_subviridis.AAC.16